MEMNKNEKQIMHVLNDVTMILKKSYDTYADGFQVFKDSFATISILKMAADIPTQIAELKGKRIKLSKEFIKDATEEFVANNLDTFGVGSKTNEEGVESTVEVIGILDNLIEIGIEAGKDGINLDDVIYIPPVVTNASSLVGNLDDMVAELKDLTPKETGIILGAMASMVFGKFK